MLLELANGGECDACKTFVEESVLRLVEVQEAKTKEAMEHARANGVDFKALARVAGGPPPPPALAAKGKGKGKGTGTGEGDGSYSYNN